MRDGKLVGFTVGMVEGMAAESTFSQFDLLGTQRGEPFPHDCRSGKQPSHRVRLPVQIDQRFKQRHHSAAFGQQWLFGLDVRLQLRPQHRTRG